jgi:hypothetical protein
MQGYYTNSKGECKGYWDLEEQPKDGEFIFIKSGERPPLVPDPLTDKQQGKQLDLLIQKKRNDFIDALMSEDTNAQATIKADVADLKSQKGILDEKINQADQVDEGVSIEVKR